MAMVFFLYHLKKHHKASGFLISAIKWVNKKTYPRAAANIQPSMKDPTVAMIQNAIWVPFKQEFWFCLHEHIPSVPVTIIHTPATIADPLLLTQ